MLIDRVFEKFTLLYGDRFADKWKDTDQDAMRETWTNALKVYEREHIAGAFELLLAENPFPPNLVEFTALCKRAKGSGQPMYQPAPKLPAPDFSDATEAAKQRCLAMLESLTLNNRPSYDWAYRLKARERSGEKLAQSQKTMLAQFERESGITL